MTTTTQKIKKKIQKQGNNTMYSKIPLNAALLNAASLNGFIVLQGTYIHNWPLHLSCVY